MRLFIADADQEVRVGLQMFLNQEPGMPVVGIAVHSKGLLKLLATCLPDVLLMDWHLPGQPPTEVLANLKALEWPPQIIIMSVHPEEESEAMAAGADSFVAKSAPPDKLITILRRMRSPPAEDGVSQEVETYE